MIQHTTTSTKISNSKLDLFSDNKLIIITFLISLSFIVTGIALNAIQRDHEEQTQISSDYYTNVNEQGEDISSENIPNYNVEDLPSDVKEQLHSILEQNPNLQILTPVYYTSEEAEAITEILSQYNITDTSIKKLVTLDPNLQQELSPDSNIYFISDIEGNLVYLDWRDTRKSHKIFIVNQESIQDNIINGDSFSYSEKTINLPIVTKRLTLASSITTNLHNTLAKLGLTNSQQLQVSNALRFQVNLNKLPPTAIIQLIVDQEFIDDKLLRNEVKSISAIHLNVGKNNYYAFRVGNNFQDSNAQANVQSFARIPLLRSARITSNFNLRRKNPVTGKIAPHYGTDFGTPSGTPVIAPANGTVTKVAYQANGAGRYMIIKHDATYTTVYMHLSRTLVKVGDKVKKGQRIAQTGNTGRSTGPHLHYEVHVNGVPRNPMTVSLPKVSTITAAQEKQLQTIKTASIKTFTANLQKFKATK